MPPDGAAGSPVPLDAGAESGACWASGPVSSLDGTIAVTGADGGVPVDGVTADDVSISGRGGVPGAVNDSAAASADTSLLAPTSVPPGWSASSPLCSVVSVNEVITDAVEAVGTNCVGLARVSSEEPTIREGVSAAAKGGMEGGSGASTRADVTGATA